MTHKAMFNEDIFVVIPAFNEAKSIACVVATVRQLGHNVVVVDDCSTDDTVAIASREGAHVLELPIHLGAWGGTQAGMRYALSMGAKNIVTLDADGQHRPEDIQSLCAATTEDVDIIIGACLERGSNARKVAWRLFRTLTGLNVYDLTSGFRLYTAKAARILIKRESLFFEYQDIGVLLLARSKGLRMKEVPVTMLPRAFGKSHIFQSWFQVFYYMIYTLFIVCVRRK